VVFYGRFQTKEGTWVITGPHSSQRAAEDTTLFFAGDRNFEVLTEKELKEKAKNEEIDSQ
jgi:hypothetical protein